MSSSWSKSLCWWVLRLALLLSAQGQDLGFAAAQSGQGQSVWNGSPTEEFPRDLARNLESIDCSLPNSTYYTCKCPGLSTSCVTAIRYSGIGLSGPLSAWARLADLSELEIVDLSNNKLTGTIPRSWFKKSAFKSLQKLQLRNNSLSGSLPEEFVGEYDYESVEYDKEYDYSEDYEERWQASSANNGWRQLQVLDLGLNQFTGSVPLTYGFTGLEVLALDHNQLQGNLPYDFLEEGIVEQVYLGHNQLTGTIPSQWGEAEYSSPWLRVLMLDNNQLTGTLPRSWQRFMQLRVLGLQGNSLSGTVGKLEPLMGAGTVPVQWAKAWGGPSREVALQLDLWPGNAALCGPAWGQQAAGGAWLELPNLEGQQAASITDAGPITYSTAFWEGWWREQEQGQQVPVDGDASVWNSTSGSAVVRAAVHLTNSLGSCMAPCSPASTAPISTNLYDLSWRLQLGLQVLLPVNDPLSVQNLPSQQVLLPCGDAYNTSWPGRPYLGGDVAFRQTAMSGGLDASLLVGVGSVVSTPPGQVPSWGVFSWTPLLEEDPATAAAAAGRPGLWAVDLGASMEVSLILVTPGRRLENINVHVGDDTEKVTDNTLCMGPLTIGEGEGGSGARDGANETEVLVAAPGRCRGRFVIFYGPELSLVDVQVYPALANAALHKPAVLSSGGQGVRELTDGRASSCMAWSDVAAGGGGEGQAAPRVLLDLQYTAMVAGVKLFAADPPSGLLVGLTNDSTLADTPGAWCEVSTSTQPYQAGGTSMYAAACSLMQTGRYVVIMAKANSVDPSLQLCELEVFLAQAPAAKYIAVQEGGNSVDGGFASPPGWLDGGKPDGDKGEDTAAKGGSTGSPAGIIVGATIGGVLGLAALASCAACAASYRSWRRTQRQHTKLTRKLAASQAGMADSGTSKDGMLAAAAIEAMSSAAHKTEMQLLSSFVTLKMRRMKDSVSSCACCWSPARARDGTGGGPPAHTPGLTGSRLHLLPLYYLSGRKRRGLHASAGDSATASNGTDHSEISHSGQQAAAVTALEVKEGEDAQLGAPAPVTALRAESGGIQLSSIALGGLLEYSDIEFGRYLGDGSFGSVHLAKWKHAQVAVKVLQRVDPKLLHAEGLGLGGQTTRSGFIAEQTLRELAKEAGIMASLRHPCIVSYIGACLDPPCLVMEYCARGSVYGVLSGASADPLAARALTWPRLLRFAWDAAKGMLYLHTLKPPVVHRDLKSANLLVDANWHVKVSDFNLSRVMEPANTISTLSAANPRWMAPEVISGHVPTLAADVFSFGVVLWELLTWDLPWHMQMNPFQIANSVVAGGRLAAPPANNLRAGPLQVYDEYVELMHSCWHPEPEDRPTFETIVSSLQRMTTIVVQSSRKQLAEL